MNNHERQGARCKSARTAKEPPPTRVLSTAAARLLAVGNQDLSVKPMKLSFANCTSSWSSCRNGCATRGRKICIVFEGRDGAGKGGVIKAITARVSPRIFRVVALPAPTEREKSQMYIQRYLPHLPAGGEVVIFDRSWYNRAGVERVMGFCTEDQAKRFLDVVPNVEKAIVEFRRNPAQVLARGEPRRADETARGSASTTDGRSGSSPRWT